MYRMNVWSVAVCLAASCLAACSRTVAGPSADAGRTGVSAPAALTIIDTLWKLQSFQPSGSASVPVSNPERFTMELRADGRVSVRADCNRCSATYSVSGETLAVGPNAACTRAACASAPFDQQYVRALAGATMARVSGDTLECVSPSGILRFAR